MHAFSPLFTYFLSWRLVSSRYSFFKVVMQLVRCCLFKAIEPGVKENCANCVKWTGKRCRDEAELLALWEKEHGTWEYMMRENRGVYLQDG